MSVNAPDSMPPGRNPHGSALERNFDARRRSFEDCPRIPKGRLFGLLAALIEALAEVALAIEQCDADERQP
jgi:hypothetical protein